MTWQPLASEPEANLEGPIIENVRRIVERDFKGALDYYFPDDNLDDFKEREVGALLGVLFPAFAVGPSENATTDAADGSFLNEGVRIEAIFAVVAPSIEEVTFKAIKYAKVFNNLLRSSRLEMVQDLSNPFGVTLSIEQRYDALRENNPLYLQEVGAIVTLTFNER